MRFVLVGGSGYIGTAVSSRLQELGHEVTNVSRTAKGAAGAKGVSYDHLPLIVDGAGCRDQPCWCEHRRKAMEPITHGRDR